MKDCLRNGRIELLVGVVGEQPERCSVPVDFTPGHVVAELKKRNQLPPEAKAREVVRDGRSVARFNVQRTLRAIGARDGDVLLVGVPDNEPEGIAVLSGDEFTGLVYTCNNLMAVIGTLTNHDISVVERSLTDSQLSIFNQCCVIVRHWANALELGADDE